MALNPYTLNHLYEKGILDYVPTDLAVGAPVVQMNAPMTPYLNSAMQGNLYQNSINGSDMFTPTFTPHPEISPSQNLNYNQGSYGFAGSMSNAGGLNTFLGNGIGRNNNSSIANTFGFNIGSNSNAGVYNSFFGNGTGDQYNGGGLNTFGGFSDTQNSIKSGAYKTMAVINNTPKFLLGLLAGGLGLGAIMYGFKRGKKPPKTPHTSFLSKLNPLNWFKKKK